MTTKARLQRGVGVALWRQIADGIRTGIAGGLADANGRLPPEAQLAERFGVNRHTVRAAIAALAHEGVLQSEQGRGTYVRRQKRLVYPIGERTRFSAGLGDQARETRSDMMGSATETAPEQVAAALGRDSAKARIAALVDALCHKLTMAVLIDAEMIAPLQRELDAADEKRQQQTAATRVDFFTMVRGED